MFENASGCRLGRARRFGMLVRKHVGGAEAEAWEALVEMEKVDLEAGQNGAGGVSLVVDLAKVFENGSRKESSSFCAATLRNQDG